MSFDVHIIGAGRGGTSLLMGLIDSHPHCEIMSEALSTGFLMGRTWTTAESHRDPRERVRLRVENFIQACNHESEKHPEKFWGHKTTTEHIMALGDLSAESPYCNSASDQAAAHSFDFLGCYLSLTRDIPTIFILRDGRSCIRSKMQRTGQSLEVAIGRWKFSVEVLRRLQKTATRLSVIKLEDLVLRPEEQLQHVCRFLNLDFTKEMLKGTNSAKILPEYRRAGFDRRPIETVEEPWTHFIAPELRQCGYL